MVEATERDAFRFWANVAPNDETGCWVWTGCLDGYHRTRNHGGYGQFYVQHRQWKSHRFAYEFLVGPVPLGLNLDHLCRNRACCNPAHLEPVTQKENVRRGVGMSSQISKAKTHCKRGHELTPENTYLAPCGDGRRCWTCIRAYPDLRTNRHRGPRKKKPLPSAEYPHV